MPFNPSGQSADYHYLVEFHLDSTTLRFADEDISIQHSNTTGFFYEGKLPQIGSLNRQLSSFIEPKETLQSFDIVIDNTDEKIQTYIKDMTFANREVNVFLGEGESIANYSVVFPGNVAHPAGIQWDEDAAQITIIDRRLKDRRNLPKTDFTSTDFPNLQRNASGLSVPIIYGDYSSAHTNSISVLAYCISTTAANKRFKVADHRINSLDRVLQNGLVVDYQNVSLDNATFELVGTYNATNDIITANVKGVETLGGTLIETPQDVLKSILTTQLEVSTNSINLTAFTDINVNVDDKCRRVIRDDISSETLVGELINEAGIELRFVGGKYSPVYRLITDKSTQALRGDNLLTIDESDLVLEDITTDKAAISFQRDTERTFANKVKASYNFDSVFGYYLGDYEQTVTSSVAAVSSVVERPMSFNWLYEKDDVVARVQRELVQYSVEPTEVTATVSHKLLQRDLADVFLLDYNIFDNRAFQIRRLDTNLASMTTTVVGFGLDSIALGNWTDDSVPSYTAASIQQIFDSGWWANNDGFVVSGVSDTKDISIWF